MKPDALKSKEKHAPAAPDRAAGLSRRAQFTILFFIAAVVAWAWLFGPFRAPKEQTPAETAAPSEAASFTPTPQQWASMRTATVKDMEFLPQRQAEGKIAVDDHLA